MSNIENMIDMKKEVEKLYIKLQKKSGLKIGDMVRVTRIAEDFENGWQHVWIMDETIGKTYKIKSIHEYEGIQLENGFFYPFFVLEKVEKIEKIYHVGQKFLHFDNEYILARVFKNHINLIRLKDGWNWSTPQKVNDTERITEKEMEDLANKNNHWHGFKLVINEND